MYRPIVELGPTIITAPINPPNPPLPPPPLGVPGGYIARPLPWDGKITDFSNIDALLRKVNFAHPDSTITQIILVAIGQKQIEDSYNANLPHLQAEIDSEISAAAESELSALEKLKKEKSAIDEVIIKAKSELNAGIVTANSFFGRSPLQRNINLNAVDFVNSYFSSGALDFKSAYKRFFESYSAAYRGKYLSEKIRLLTEKSNVLTNNIARAQAAENIRLAAQAEAQRAAAAAAERVRIAAEAEAKRVADEEAAYKDALSFLAATNEEFLKKYGSEMSKIAQGLQTNISGKKVRSYSDAMATFEKVRVNPKIKLNAKDTQAIVDALNALDKITFADNVSRLGKAFGVVGKIVQADAILDKTIDGFKTGDWRPLGLELESMAVGALAGAVAGALLAAFFAFAGAPFIITIPVIAVVMALVASYLDPEKIDEINNYLFNLL